MRLEELVDVAGTAEWRSLKAEEYPNDDRNGEAVELLDKLAKDFACLGRQPLAQVCGLLWNCTDVLPGSYVSIVQDLVRDWDTRLGSYAQAARALKEAL